MARERAYLFAMNGGEASPLALARVDLQRMKIMAETMLNCFPRVIGMMQFRPGLGYQASTASDAAARNIPFVFAADDTALVEVSAAAMRFIINGTALTRVSVATVVTNGDFSSATGWTLTTTSDGVATISGGVLTLQTPTRGGTTLCKRQVTVAGGDVNKEHGLRIVINRGPVVFRCGSTDGGDEYIAETELNTGTYSLALTPTGNFWVQFSVKSEVARIVDSITVESAGVVSLTPPWAAADLRYLRWYQSGDVIFVANTQQTYQPRRIERRSARSWGLALYEFKDGPWRGKTANVTFEPNGALGNITLTASAPFFQAGHVGALFRLYHSETETDVDLGGDDEFTDTIAVHGIGNAQRTVNINISGFGSGTITMQLSYDDGLTWVAHNTWNTNASGGQVVGADNVPVLVRAGFVGSDWNSGTPNVTLSYQGGGGYGVVRVTSIVSSTVANVEVLSRLHDDFVSSDWEESRFSTLRGWPSVVGIFEGRLWFLDQDKVFGSISDDFTSFDLDEEGDSGPVIRSIANGPVNRGLWMLDLARLVIGTVGAEPVARSSSFDEPITPTNMSIKDASTQGSADVMAVKVDKAGMFIQRSGKRAYIIRFDIDVQDYASQDVTRYNPTILEAGVVGAAVQRQPDTRIWFWLDDGTAACLIYEPSEDVISWCRFETDGVIEDIAVLPNVEDDDVYMIVQRTINGSTKRYREKLAYDHQSDGGNDNYMGDSFISVAVVASATVTGLSHLEAESVVVWADGEAILDADGEPRLFTVSGGQITLPGSVTGDVIVGLAYEGRWKSAKLAYAAMSGTAVAQKKQATGVAPLVYSTHARGVLFGKDFTRMDAPPRTIRGVAHGINDMIDVNDYDEFALPGTWDNDSRLCMKFRAPLPATILATVIKMETHESG